jgi:hypothetical protein
MIDRSVPRSLNKHDRGGSEACSEGGRFTSYQWDIIHIRIMSVIIVDLAEKPVKELQSWRGPVPAQTDGRGTE